MTVVMAVPDLDTNSKLSYPLIRPPLVEDMPNWM